MLSEIDAHVFDATLPGCVDGPDGWATCLERFTNRNAFRHVIVEEDRMDRGLMRSVVDAALAGISYDRRDGSVQIMLDGEADRGKHRTVVVRDVRSVDALSEPNGRDVALRFAIPKGQVLLTFVSADHDSGMHNGW